MVREARSLRGDMAIFQRNIFQPGKWNNYVLAGNVCNAFALGAVGSTDDFFLVGAEPSDESSYPLITGNILDSEGKLLFRLVRNVLILNPGVCSKIQGDMLGYEIHDSAGNLVFKVRTVFEQNPALGENGYFTTISASFYDKNKNLVFRANSGDQNEMIEKSCPGAFGFNGAAFAFNAYSPGPHKDMAIEALRSGGAVHEILSGEIKDKTIDIEGKYLKDAIVVGCKVVVGSGNFRLANTKFSGCSFEFKDAANQIKEIVLVIAKASGQF